ncbi:MAG: beta-mannanase [Burkholderiales bacterium]|nr:beta-mannanase [Phycisphaerae bacterium]
MSLPQLLGCASIDPITLRADQGKLQDLTLATTRPGFSGAGYAAGFKNSTGEIEWTFEAPHPGIYDLQIRYSASGAKGYELILNDVGYDGTLPASPRDFSEHNAGKVEIAQGKNVLKLGRGWGNYDIDSIKLVPSGPLAPPKAVAAKLADPLATPAACALMERLAQNYGRGTFTGVIKDADRKHVESVTGMTPMVMGGDLMEYSPSRREHGSNPRNETERLIAAAAAGHIVTYLWHWNAPTDLINQRNFVTKSGKRVDASWYRGFYTEATTFDFAAALDQPDSPAYALLIRDIDVIAAELKKLDAAGVPVLWRPLHESDGKWFWWGARGPDNLKRLWRLLHDRLTNHHQLHNLIWVYTWNDHDWYPGDDVVDMIGMDAYPKRANDPLIGKWADALRHFDGKKMIALTEIGGTADVPRMRRLGAHWSFFASWTGAQGPQKTPEADLRRIYQSPDVLNLGGR